MRFGNSIEDLSIKKIQAGIRGIKNGTKTIKEANVNYFLNKLKPYNSTMHAELEDKYLEVVRNKEEKIW